MFDSVFLITQRTERKLPPIDKMQPEPLDETVPLTDKQYRELNLYKVGDLQGKVSEWSIDLTLYCIGYF